MESRRPSIATFAHPANFHPTSAWIGVLFYAIQIYCDFPDTPICHRRARLLGYQLPITSGSRTSLRTSPISAALAHQPSSWLRDYLYIPLGGNRGPALVVYRNIMITMLPAGLWHGAAWTFVIWARYMEPRCSFIESGHANESQVGRAGDALFAWPITIYADCVALDLFPCA